jgi:hypothetical protein
MNFELTSQQQSAFNDIMSGKNVFLTGEGGTGKSVTIRQAISHLREEGKDVVVCAPTGIAAVNVNGTTIHRVFKLKTTPQVDVHSLGVSDVIKAADVIIVDEISMVRRDMMDAIGEIVRKENKRRINAALKKPAGMGQAFSTGDDEKDTKTNPLQVVLCGDFSQLAPVTTNQDRPALVAHYDCDPKSNFLAFESEYWAKLRLTTHVLTQIMRQVGDNELVEELNKARIADPSCIDFFNTLVSDSVHRDMEHSITLCSTNKAASAINDEMVRTMGRGEPFLWRLSETGEVKSSDKCVDDRLVLREGTRVLVNSNDQDGRYVNGDMGTVVNPHYDYGKMEGVEVRIDRTGQTVLIEPKSWEVLAYGVIKNKEGKSSLVEDAIGSYRQIPLRIGYAITIHKSQGQTYDSVVIDPRPAFKGAVNPGLLYVALSRCRTRDGIHLTHPIDPEWLTADALVTKFYGWLDSASEEEFNANASEDNTLELYREELSSAIESDANLPRIYALLKAISENEIWKKSASYKCPMDFVADALKDDTSIAIARDTFRIGSWLDNLAYFMPDVADWRRCRHLNRNLLAEITMSDIPSGSKNALVGDYVMRRIDVRTARKILNDLRQKGAGVIHPLPKAL